MLGHVIILSPARLSTLRVSFAKQDQGRLALPFQTSFLASNPDFQRVCTPRPGMVPQRVARNDGRLFFHFARVFSISRLTRASPAPWVPARGVDMRTGSKM